MSDNRINAPSQFVEPHYIPELGEDGLLNSDIATALGVRISEVNRKLSRLDRWKNNSVFHLVSYDTVVTTGNNGHRQVTAWALNLPAAKAFIARWENDLGDGYLAFLFDCERKVTEELPRLQSLVSKLQSAIDSQWKHRPKGLPRGRQRGQVTIPVERETLFGRETVWVEALREQASALQLLLAERSHIIKVNRGLHRRLEEIEARLEAPEKQGSHGRRHRGNVIKMLHKPG